MCTCWTTFIGHARLVHIVLIVSNRIHTNDHFVPVYSLSIFFVYYNYTTLFSPWFHFSINMFIRCHPLWMPKYMNTACTQVKNSSTQVKSPQHETYIHTRCIQRTSKIKYCTIYHSTSAYSFMRIILSIWSFSCVMERDARICGERAHNMNVIVLSSLCLYPWWQCWMYMLDRLI